MHLFRGWFEFLQIFSPVLPLLDLHELVDKFSSVRQGGRQELVGEFDPDVVLTFAFQTHFPEDFFFEEKVEVQFFLAFFEQLFINLTIFPMVQILRTQLYQNNGLEYDQKKFPFLHEFFKVNLLIHFKILEFLKLLGQLLD
jgi:hypothetical protein